MKTLKSYNILHISSDETLPATEAKASALLQITYILALVVLQDFSVKLLKIWNLPMAMLRWWRGG